MGRTTDVNGRQGWSLNPDCLMRLRVLAGCSQAELARRSGLSQGHISELERGDKVARPGTIKKLAVALAVPMQALLDNDLTGLTTTNE